MSQVVKSVGINFNFSDACSIPQRIISVFQECHNPFKESLYEFVNIVRVGLVG